MSERWRVPLPPRRRAALRVFVNGVPQEEGADYEVVGPELHFSKPLEKERHRRRALDGDLPRRSWGHYGKNDSVDVQYRIAGRQTVATGTGHHPAGRRLNLFRPCASSQILESRRPVFSLRVLPAEDRRGAAARWSRPCHVLKDDAPDYVSVTYGAGGTTRDRTVEITKWIKQDLGIEAMAHLSLRRRGRGAAGGDPRGDRGDAGIENVLALRGDPPRGETEWKAAPRAASATRSS